MHSVSADAAAVDDSIKIFYKTPWNGRLNRVRRRNEREPASCTALADTHTDRGPHRRLQVRNLPGANRTPCSCSCALRDTNGQNVTNYGGGAVSLNVNTGVLTAAPTAVTVRRMAALESSPSHACAGRAVR
jgi:hypothetical protein